MLVSVHFSFFKIRALLFKLARETFVSFSTLMISIAFNATYFACFLRFSMFFLEFKISFLYKIFQKCYISTLSNVHRTLLRKIKDIQYDLAFCSLKTIKKLHAKLAQKTFKKCHPNIFQKLT